MSATTMHFGPEWMRPKQQSISRSQQPPSPPPTAQPPAALSTYSALVSPVPPNQTDTHDEAHPFRYTKDDLLKIFKDVGKVGLGLEVERWEGVVREYGSDPIGLREVGEAEKKLFAGPLNSDVRRRQSTDYLSPLSTTNLGQGGSRLNHSSPAVGSPMRERFGNIKRRDSNAVSSSEPPNPVLPRKQSLSNLQPPAVSPREIGNPVPRARVGYSPGFDGVLSGGDSRVARRRTTDAPQKPGGNTPGIGGDGDLNDRTEGIKEEKENENVSNLASLPGAQDNGSASSINTGDFKDVNSLAVGLGQLSLNTNISSPINNSQNYSVVGAPPGLVDLASIEWSYKDPTGTVQGPFSADLMQKWFDDGYFTPDLPMKRTQLDTTWSTLEQLRRRCPSDRIFLTPLQPTPPGLSMRNDSPLQYNGSEQSMPGPYQPAPIRSMRTPTLESYISTGSNHSESPSSSFGVGRFVDSSPEPNSFGGRMASGQYFNGDPSGSARGSGFQTTPEIPAAFSNRRGIHAESPVDGSPGMKAGAFGGLGYSNPFGSAQNPWGTATSNFGSGYDAIGAARDPHDHSVLQNYPNQGLGINYNSTRNSDPILDTTMNYPVDPEHSARVLGADHQFSGINLPLAGEQLYPQAAQQFSTQPQQSASADVVYPEQAGSSTGSTQQSPWSNTTESTIRSDRLFNSSQPTISNSTAQPITGLKHTSVWDQPIHPQASPSVSTPEGASPWVTTAHVPVNNAWRKPAEGPSANSDPEAVVKAHQSPVEQIPVNITPDAPEQPKLEPEVVDTPSVPTPPVASPPISGKSRKQKEPKAPVALALPPPQPEVSSPQIPTPKPAWQKEDDTKKTISLREIQEAESKKAEAKKVAERERDRAARAAAASPPDKDEIQAFTTSWGLPTSQAGARAAQLPVREVATAPTPSAAAPVWTNAPKAVPARKTMKEILEEEEKRKKIAPQATAALTVAASAPRRHFAEPTTKPPTAAFGGAWMMVGPNGKSNPPPSVASSRLGTSAATAPSHPNGSILIRPTQIPASKTTSIPATRVEDATPSHEFLNWLNDALKGLNNSVSVEEIMHMLLSFPIEADASIREIISETIYTNSTTMDGRRFADEFVSRRKVDAITNAGVSKATPKPTSIADVVKAAPKTTQPEWGFKVVNKKKKGGRS